MIILQVIGALFLIYFSFFILYYFALSVAGRLRSRKDPSHFRAEPGRFAVLIPAYKEDGVIEDTARRALQHNYPADKMEVVVCADGLQPRTLERLRAMPIRVVEVQLEKSGKAASMNYALRQLSETDFDYVMVLDADNVMEKDCLLHLNEVLAGGAMAVQGQRTAKNKDKPIALLESISEMVNNHIFRRGPQALGLSSSLIGSGMAFRQGFFRHLMHDISSIWEDRDLEMKIFREGQTIAYVQGAIIYDEKVSNYAVFKNQRAKWLAGQIASVAQVGEYWNGGRMNRNLANMFLRSIAPPRSFVFIFLALLLVYALFVPSGIMFFAVLGGLFFITLLLAVPVRMLNFELLKASLRLPVFLVVMFGSLIQSIVRQDNRYHTPHTPIKADEGA